MRNLKSINDCDFAITELQNKIKNYANGKYYLNNGRKSRAVSVMTFKLRLIRKFRMELLK
jgi:hypothetical protein